MKWQSDLSSLKYVKSLNKEDTMKLKDKQQTGMKYLQYIQKTKIKISKFHKENDNLTENWTKEWLGRKMCSMFLRTSYEYIDNVCSLPVNLAKIR